MLKQLGNAGDVDSTLVRRPWMGNRMQSSQVLQEKICDLTQDMQFVLHLLTLDPLPSNLVDRQRRR